MVFGRYRNFAWLTGGGSNRVDITSDMGVALLKIGARDATLITDVIEEPRMRAEVADGLPLDVVAVPWQDRAALVQAIRSGKRPRRLTGDVSIPGAGIAQAPRPFWTMQIPLFPDEQDRYRALGADAAAVVRDVARRMEPGWTEQRVAGEVAHGLHVLGIQPVVLLVGADARLERYRHPVPTALAVERACMIVVCAERGGLVASLTRMVHFGPVPEELAARHRAVAGIDAAIVQASRPGAVLGDVFRQGMAAYEAAGYADEWQQHHQGGTTGFNTRDVIATPESAETLVAGQAVAWNPSVPGAKSEDTFLVTDDGPELLTADADWPMADAGSGEAVLSRPAILER